MSADDWIPCPFCSKKYQEQISDLELRLKQAYEKMTAKDYDKLKGHIHNEITQIKEGEEDKAYARIDGSGDYGFDEQGDFHINASAYCPHCERGWQIDQVAKPSMK